MTDIIVSDALDITESYWQHRLGAIQRLDLALLIDAQHRAWSGGFRYRPRVAYFLHEKRIGGEFETPGAMRLQGKGLEQAMTVDLEIPLSWAAWRMLQCVPPAGLRESVRLSKAAICSSAILRGRPDATRRKSPRTGFNKTLSPLADRYVPPTQAAAISVLFWPCADQSTTWARDTSEWGKVRDVVKTLQLCMFVGGQFESSLGASDRHNAAYGRPRILMQVIYGTLH